MKQRKVWVRWPEGLHVRPASRLVNAARRYRSAIRLKHGGKVADARSILALLMLGASFGAPLDLEVSGDDEEAAISEVATVFETETPSADKNPFFHAPARAGW
jgi:phosphotransferase system HPr (HPr) family protein